MSAEEKKEKLLNIKKKIDLANKVRMIFLFLAVVILAILYFGDKMLTGIPWYDTFSSYALFLVSWEIIIITIASFTKLGLSIVYNRVLKS